MAKSKPSRAQRKPRKTTSPLMVRLDAESKACLTRAAELRRISVSDYVRTVTLAQRGAKSLQRVSRQSLSPPMSRLRSGPR